MKIKIFAIMMIATLLGACESFLDKSPLDQVASDDYWKTASDLELYVNQYYPSLRGLYGPGAWGGKVTNDNNSDFIIRETPDSRLRGSRSVPASGGGWNWGSIRSINYFLTHYQTVDEDWENIKQYIGEAYFFRAYYYFDLLKQFGDVPWINKPLDTDSEELYTTQTSRDVVADSIVADLDRAYAYMLSKDNAPTSRLYNDLALLFKSRVCLYEGTWEKYHANTDFGVDGSDGQKFLALAANAASTLINSGNYGVYDTDKPQTDYASVFIQENPVSHPEIMYWRTFDYDLGIEHGVSSAAGNGHGLTKWLVDNFLCDDGLPISLSPKYQGDDSDIEVTTNRDPRLSTSIWVKGDTRSITDNDTVFYIKPDIDKSGENLNTTGYQLKKGFQLVAWKSSEVKTYNTVDVIFRFAEVLLNYAEAKAELSTITQADLDMSINKLRNRAGLPDLLLNNIAVDPDWAFPSLTPIINEIRRERNSELMAEGFRLEDLLRWRAHSLFKGKRPKGAIFQQSDFPEMVIGENIFVDGNGYIDPYQNSLPNGYGFDPDRDYLNPIPTLELTLNPALIQNPGWEKD